MENENEIFGNPSVISDETENIPEIIEETPETPAETASEETVPEIMENTPEIPTKKKKKGLKIFIVVMGVILGIALILAITFVAVVYHYIGMIDVRDPKQTDEIVDVIPPDDDVTDEPDSPQVEIDKIDDIINQNTGTNNGNEPSEDDKTDDNTSSGNNNSGGGNSSGGGNNTSKPQQTVQPIYDENVYNVLLIGTDSRNKTDRGRSDSVILLSINKKTEEIHLTSFMRDSYVAIPGKYNNRINAAYAYGGADLLMDTIELNYKVKVDKYVRVNFFSFMEVIDVIGGVTMTVSNAEVKVMNNYIWELNKLLGKDKNDGMLSKGGTYNLTGKQALGYCRIRYVGNADFQRTQRQRDVLIKVLEKVKGMSISEMNDFLEIFLPKVTTNIPENEIFSLVMNSLTYTKYPVYQHRIPTDGSWWNLRVRGMAVLGMNFNTNIDLIRKEVYGK